MCWLLRRTVAKTVASALIMCERAWERYKMYVQRTQGALRSSCLLLIYNTQNGVSIHITITQESSKGTVDCTSMTVILRFEKFISIHHTQEPLPPPSTTHRIILPPLLTLPLPTIPLAGPRIILLHHPLIALLESHMLNIAPLMPPFLLVDFDARGDGQL